jgi:ABC-type transporter MlaC component
MEFGHLRDVEQTYREHFHDALEIAGILFAGAFASIIHAIDPDLMQNTASEKARQVIRIVDAKHRRARKPKKKTKVKIVSELSKKLLEDVKEENEIQIIVVKEDFSKLDIA